MVRCRTVTLDNRVGFDLVSSLVSGLVTDAGVGPDVGGGSLIAARSEHHDGDEDSELAQERGTDHGWNGSEDQPVGETTADCTR